MHRLALVLAVAACGPPPAGPSPSPPPSAPPAAAAPSYRASIRWTAHGVPHIVAADLGGLGFGQGYAQAQARLCEISDGIVRVRGERARYLGAVHVASDLAHRHLGYHARAEAALAAASSDTQAMIAGFAAGYSHALAAMPAPARPAACRDAPWLGPITAVDVAAYGLALQGLGSLRFLTQAIADAEPGAGASAPPAPPPTAAPPGGSNAWGLGGDRTASGGGLLVANPHFPWQGDLLFHEAHLTIPGDLDVYGAALIGTPGIQIGATPHHAWSHTFSAATHMVIYRVELDPSRPLRYRHGDDTRAIVPSRYPIAVRGDDGTVATRSYTRYRSAVGPMIATAAAPWGGPGGHAFTVHDVTGGALALDAYLAMARARDQAGFEAALALHATPFVNTVYVDGTGTALYVDGSRVPDLAPEALATWQLLRKVAPPIEAAWRQRLVILDGSEPANDLLTDEPRAPGAIPIARAPRVERRDFVMNANDSFRFTNLAAPETLAPASPLWGDDAERPSVRTLANLAALAPGAGPAGPDDRFTLDEAIAAMLGNASWTAARLRDDVAAACPRRATGDLARACAVLAAWDGEFDVTSRGALVWREVLAGLEVDGALPWARRFDRQAPRLTPDGLSVPPAAIARALVGAVARLRARGLAPDATLGEGQRAHAAGGAAPVPGGSDRDGVTNIAIAGRLDATALDYPPAGAPYPIEFGTSFVLAAEYTPTGRTVRALLSYGQSSDPASPWYRDQLVDLAAGRLRDVPLTDAAIAADPAYRLEELSSP
jgi:acyl-homoserine-lactone acylase